MRYTYPYRYLEGLTVKVGTLLLQQRPTISLLGQNYNELMYLYEKNA
jgi:hypothetical protein